MGWGGKENKVLQYFQFCVQNNREIDENVEDLLESYDSNLTNAWQSRAINSF